MDTLAFLNLNEYLSELAARSISETHMQPMISTEPMGNDPGYRHTWAVVLTARDRQADEVLVVRVLVAEHWSGYAQVSKGVFPAHDADLALAADAIAQDLAAFGFSAYPGYYPHAPVGYGEAPGLWHFQGKRLVLEALPDAEGA